MMMMMMTNDIFINPKVVENETHRILSYFDIQNASPNSDPEIRSSVNRQEENLISHGICPCKEIADWK